MDQMKNGKKAAPSRSKRLRIVMPGRKNIDGLLSPESKRAGRAYNEALEDVELLNEQTKQGGLVSIRSELLERIDESAICDGTECSIDAELFLELVSVLRRPRE